MGLKLVTAPTVEPVTIEEAKLYLRIDDTSLDDLVSALVIAGRIYCENFQNRAYITQTWDLTMDSYPNAAVNPGSHGQLGLGFPYSFNRFPGTTEALRLPKSPLQSVSFIKFTDDAGAVITWPQSNYIVDVDSEPGRIGLMAGASWPNITLQPISGVRIRYIVGYGDAGSDVPQNIKQAILLFMAHRFENPTDSTVPDVVHHLLWQDRMVEWE